MTIAEAKLPTTPGTPILLFQIVTASGDEFAVSSHAVSVQGIDYSARVLRHDVLEMGGSATDAIDALGEVRLVLANADSFFSQVHRAGGWKGANLSTSVCFFDLATGLNLTEPMLVFRGIGNAPDEITETTLRLTFTSRMNLQRAYLPDTRIQRVCPWAFPTTLAQRQEAVDGGDRGRYSPFYRCGYSADIEGGLGSLDATGQAFMTCNGSREHCHQRGMLHKDTRANTTGHFGGLGFVPATSLVRTYGDKSTHSSAVLENEAKYNEVVPLIYGTAWYRPPVVVSKNDGNLTHLEVLLGMGEIHNVLRVVVNDIELPSGNAGMDHTATGWYNVVNHGHRTGQYNLDFVSRMAIRWEIHTEAWRISRWWFQTESATAPAFHESKF